MNQYVFSLSGTVHPFIDFGIESIEEYLGFVHYSTLNGERFSTVSHSRGSAHSVGP